MRPVLLEMAGFGSFREPTTVDFAGADYFALVGSTGAGKSTVIDAMTFALYGSVPRWDDRRTVALALAPTAGRGAVRLVFDVGGARYVVARELRRAASGGVSVRNARLERLLDPAGSGTVEEETEPLADGAAATTTAVEELLGLPFGDFCTCVVLPQGEFAEFLHAEPRKRQEKLVRILGLGVYDEIARAANSEAARERARADVLGSQLAGFVDATAEVEQAAADRVAALEGLAARIGAGVPALASAAADRDAARTLAERLRADRALLRALVVPAGVSQLHAREGAAATARRAATERAAAAEMADTALRQRLAKAPHRAELPAAERDQHTELATGQAELPGLRERGEKALADYQLAEQDAADAQDALDRARTGRDAAAGALDAARSRRTPAGRRAGHLPGGVRAGRSGPARPAPGRGRGRVATGGRGARRRRGRRGPGPAGAGRGAAAGSAGAGPPGLRGVARGPAAASGGGRGAGRGRTRADRGGGVVRHGAARAGARADPVGGGAAGASRGHAAARADRGLGEHDVVHVQLSRSGG